MTTHRQKFENLFETCVAAARNAFLENGALHTRWIIEDKNNVRLMIVFDPEIPKEDMLEQMHRMANDKGIVRYVVETETWMATGDGPRPSQRPDRMEAIVVMGADREGNGAFTSIEIERKGGRHYLGDTVRGDGVAAGAFQIFSNEGETQ